MEITDEQRRRAEANRLAALAKRRAHTKAFADQQPTKVVSSSSVNLAADIPQLTPNKIEKFLARLEICSVDTFCVTPVPIKNYEYPGDAECFLILLDCLSEAIPSLFTPNTGGGEACVYKLSDYDAIANVLKKQNSIEVEKIPFGTLHVLRKMSNSCELERWEPCRPEHLRDVEVNDIIKNVPRKLLDTLLPFQLDGLRFGLRRGGRCLIADEMGLGKTLQAIAIACCYMNEGPILVVCPAVLRYPWAEELERWMPLSSPSNIHLVFGRRNNPLYLAKFPRVVVISYAMLHRLQRVMLKQDWGLLIVDESHHVRCSKSKSESKEIKAVIELGAKIKHIVLLSGTPSLSRPYDIYHQINMLWPGLLGKDKYEFAKTYCDVKFVKTYEGKIFKDYSKGVRLQELNTLLKQTVMIRRLKSHVLQQLPPKRRQIIKLLLKNSDIGTAKTALGLNSEIPEGCGVSSHSKELSYQELGIAKLSSFEEWFSNHPLALETDAEKQINSHKTIIFAHHHKVLDGLQEIACARGIGFVRIDGNTLARDRQSAVISFQSSSEIKVAIIGLTAGGVGLNFSAAQNVVFLELPQCPSLMLQAEDRAHRRGQTSAVNVYIFCAKNTIDESLWRRLNKSLHRVSTTTNGKNEAIPNISIERISFLNNNDPPNRNLFTPQSKTTLASHRSKTHFPDLHEETINPHFLSRIEHGTSLDNAQLLRFEVSQYTGRVHLYSCIPGINTRPQPLYESYRPEEIDSFSSDDSGEKSSSLFTANSSYRNSLIEFNKQWNELRPIQRTKLMGKPLQIPLDIELSYLEETRAHDADGLLKGGSKRRKTPWQELSGALPAGAVWKKVQLVSDRGKKEREYTQGITTLGIPLCKLCQNPCTAESANTPEYFEDLFCSFTCYEDYRIRTSTSSMRHELFQSEQGVCSICRLDCHQLVKNIKPLSLESRRDFVRRVAPRIASRKKLLEKLIKSPSEGNAWHADHIIPVYRGGGECHLENMRTLCVACHADVTKAQAAERRLLRAQNKKNLQVTVTNFKVLDEETLFVKVPGSSYSTGI